MKIEWELYVHDDVFHGKGYMINYNTKVHCFVNGKSLCKRYYMVPGYFKTTDLCEKDIGEHPECFCKQCLKKYKKEVKACL